MAVLFNNKRGLGLGFTECKRLKEYARKVIFTNKIQAKTMFCILVEATFYRATEEKGKTQGSGRKWGLLVPNQN